MSKTVKPHWPDEVRLKMIEKSEFYSEPRVYQYGFYDGFQHAQSQTRELIDQKRELVEMLEKSLGALNDCCMVIDSEDEVFEHVKTLSSDINKALFNYRPKINIKWR